MLDTFGNYGTIDTHPESDEKLLLRGRLIREDAALRPWILGKAIKAFRYSRWDRIRIVARETWNAMIWSWRLSR